MIEPRSFECRLSLWIGNRAFPSKMRKLRLAAVSNGFDQSRVAVADKILKWSGLTILFTHEEHWREGRKHCHSGHKLESFKIREVADAIAQGAIPNLVVILIADDKLFR